MQFEHLRDVFGKVPDLQDDPQFKASQPYSSPSARSFRATMSAHGKSIAPVTTTMRHPSAMVANPSTVEHISAAIKARGVASTANTAIRACETLE
jgi:hypothetical protein